MIFFKAIKVEFEPKVLRGSDFVNGEPYEFSEEDETQGIWWILGIESPLPTDRKPITFKIDANIEKEARSKIGKIYVKEEVRPYMVQLGVVIQTMGSFLGGLETKMMKGIMDSDSDVGTDFFKNRPKFREATPLEVLQYRKMVGK